LKIYISKGSVATQLRCSGILSNHFVNSFAQNVQVKFFKNRLIFGADMDESSRLTF